MSQQIKTLEQAMQLLMRADVASEICYDSETSGLDVLRCHAVGHVLTFSPDPKDSFYIPVRHLGGGNVPGCSVPDDPHGWDGTDHPFETELRRIANTKQKRWFGHNIKFDNRVLHRHNITLRGHFEDTGINAALLDEYARSYSLDNLSQAAGVQAKKGEELYRHIAKTVPEYNPKGAPGRQAMAHYWRTNANDFVVWDYAAGDGTSTWQLRDWQTGQLAAEELLQVWDIECRLIPILTRMENTGIRIDLERMEEVSRIVATKLDEAMGKFPSGFNVRGADVGKYLVDKGGVDMSRVPRTKPSKRFPQGQPSFNEAFLKTVPLGREIIKARKYGNLENTFIEPLRSRHTYRGRVHTSFNQLKGDDYGTITGRLSSSEPNLQQIPKRDKELGPLFRSIFVPNEGMVWGSVDYSQCEPRLLALYGRVRVLLDGYRAETTVDAHTAVARAAEIDRDDGKRLNQALLTGAGDRKIAEMLAKPEANQIIADYFNAMPEIKVLQKRASKAMKSRGYVKSLLGRRARLEPGRDYTAVNRLLQCGNADILKLKMVEAADYLESEGNPIDILLNCHDANDFQFYEEDRKHYDRVLDIMANFGPGEVIEVDLPMEVDSGEGANWSEATYGGNKRVVRGTYTAPRELADA